MEQKNHNGEKPLEVTDEATKRQNYEEKIRTLIQGKIN